MNTFNIDEIDFLQIQRYLSAAKFDLRLQVIKVLRSKLSAQTNPYFVPAANLFDLQRHGFSALKNSQKDCNTQAIPNFLQEWKLVLRVIPQISGIPVR